eukprot:XP_010647503.1 PREDICTED: abnormal spindle-like microcephaly-associated protein homolog [Vitis vinifera]
MLTQDPSSPDPVKAASFDRRCTYEWTSRPKYTCTLSQMEKSSFIFQEKEMNDLRIKAAVKIQLAWRNFSVCNSHRNEYTAATQIQCCFRGWLLRRSFVQKKQAVINIQSHFRGWLLRKSFVKKKQTVRKIQCAFRGWLLRNLVKKQQAAIKLQSAFRGWSLRRSFVKKQQAAIKIQSDFRGLKCQRNFQIYKIASKSAIVIQSHLRGWIARKAVCRLRHQIVVIQSHCRGWLTRRDLLLQRKAVIKIQNAFQCVKCWKAFQCYRYAAIDIQRFVRGHITRNRLLGTSSLRSASPNGCTLQASRGCFPSFQLKMLLTSVLKLQRWWRGVLFLNSRTKSAIIIQSHIRGWIARREATRERHRVVVIQSYWKGYLARKESRGQLVDLRLRVQKSATSVDDGMRIINRLLAALSDLLSMKSVSGILHTCATLDMATAHSQICCEKLVAAGAINTLLKLIRSVSRSIPDQEVLKHALSTLRNLSHYPHLAEVLIDTRGSVETILWEFLRNKEEGYFLASELLKKICSNQKGVEALRNLPALLKRLHNLTEDLSRKANNEKRNIRGQAGRENTERRLKEAMELLKLTKKG